LLLSYRLFVVVVIVIVIVVVVVVDETKRGREQWVDG